MSTPATLTLPSGVARGTLDTPGGQFATLTAGPADSDLPLVLLVPGWTGSKEDFATLLPHLAATGRRVVAFDQRGQFETSGTDDAGAYTLPALAADVHAVARAVSPRPVDLVGHSFGGLVATQAALDDPLSLNSVVLLCSGPGALPPDRHPEIHAMSQALGTLGQEATWTAIRERERAAGLPAPPADIEAWTRDRFMRNHPMALAAKTDHLRTAADRSSELRDRPTPVLVLTTDRDDGWPVAAQTQMGEAVEAEVIVLDGLGHSPAVEDPARTARHLLDFFDRWRPGAPMLDLRSMGSSGEVTQIRHVLRAELEPALAPERLDEAELMVSEVVTNAVLHARPPIDVHVRVLGERLIVVVTDSRSGLPVESRANHGRGLSIVRSLAERCGSWIGETGGTVWFWLPTGPATEPDGAQPTAGDASAATSGSSPAHGLTAGPIAIPSEHDAW